MNRKEFSFIWAIIIMIVIYFFWGQQAYSWISKNSKESKTSKESSNRSSTLPASTSERITEEPITNLKKNRTTEVHFEQLNNNETSLKGKSRKIRAAAGGGPIMNGTHNLKKKIPHSAFKPHTKEEFEALLKQLDTELELRVLPGSTSTDGGGLGGEGGGGGSNEEVLRRGCHPFIKPPEGVRFARVFDDIPPCPIEEPPTEEPIPLIPYTGTRQLREDCKTDVEIAQMQLGGQSTYPPGKTIEAGLDLKRFEVERDTCDQTNGLECIEQMDETGALKPTCQCMAAFGQETSIRMEIDGKCYIPAGKGPHSDCFEGQEGFPLPTGDTQDIREWNPVLLPCVPNANCREHVHWFGRRCTCRKGYVAEEGLCNHGTQVKVIYGMTHIVTRVILVVGTFVIIT